MSVTREYESSDFAGDYEEIERAVMESARGRWFLAEFAKRQRAEDTARILDAIQHLEAHLVPPVTASNALVKPLVSEAFDSADLTAEALRYYRQDEDVFAPVPGSKQERPALRIVEGSNPRVTIRRLVPEAAQEASTTPPEPASEIAKPRIVVLRRASSEQLAIPLANEAPENAVA